MWTEATDRAYFARELRRPLPDDAALREHYWLNLWRLKMARSWQAIDVRGPQERACAASIVGRVRLARHWLRARRASPGWRDTAAPRFAHNVYRRGRTTVRVIDGWRE